MLGSVRQATRIVGAQLNTMPTGGLLQNLQYLETRQNVAMVAFPEIPLEREFQGVALEMWHGALPLRHTSLDAPVSTLRVGR